MVAYYRSLKSDLMKLRRQPLLLIHLLVPLVGLGMFLAYFAYTPYAPVSKVSGYLQIIAIAFPTMIGIVCAIASDQEASAGRYQQLLTQPSRLVPIASKLTLLLILGFSSVLLATVGFGAGFLYVLDQSPYNLGFYVQAACILFGSSVFLYALHVYISLRFGKGASIGLGIVGSLIAALLLTGLGDYNWIYIPSAWAARFITSWMQVELSGGGSFPPELLIQPGILCCIGGTVAIMVLLGGWFRRWEGRTSLE